MPEQHDTTIDPYVSVHRWPWRGEEFVSMAIVFALVLGLGYFIADMRRDTFSGNVFIGWTVGVIVAAFAAVYYLYRVKKSRTDKSQVTITITGSVVKVHSPGALGASTVDIRKARVVSYRKYNSDETFVIGDGQQSARIPVRATRDPKVRELVRDAFTTAKDISAEARDLYSRLPATDA